MNSFSKQISIREARNYLKKGVENEKIASEFYKSLENSDLNSNPLLLGYKGMSAALMAKHSLNPFSKLNYFNKARNSLDQAIRLKPEDVELRYLRFTLQTNVPGFLNYTNNITEDKKLIIKNIGRSDPLLKQDIVTFMLQSKYCNNQEKTELTNNSKN